MTPEELLRPRYKVIATWPSMELEPFRLGQIVTLRPHKAIKHVPGSYMRQGFFNTYPHLFKELAWWEERKQEDMPEYLEWDNGVVCKPYKYVGSYFYLDGGGCTSYHLKHVSIATREEYEAYQKTTTEQ